MEKCDSKRMKKLRNLGVKNNEKGNKLEFALLRRLPRTDCEQRRIFSPNLWLAQVIQRCLVSFPNYGNNFAGFYLPIFERLCWYGIFMLTVAAFVRFVVFTIQCSQSTKSTLAASQLRRQSVNLKSQSLYRRALVGLQPKSLVRTRWRQVNGTNGWAGSMNELIECDLCICVRHAHTSTSPYVLLLFTYAYSCIHLIECQPSAPASRKTTTRTASILAVSCRTSFSRYRCLTLPRQFISIAHALEARKATFAHGTPFEARIALINLISSPPFT